MEHCPPLSAPWASVSLLPGSSLIGPPGAAARVQLLTYVSAVGRHFSLTSLALPAQSIQKQPPLRREGRHFSRWSSPGKAWWQAWAWVQGEQWGGGGERAQCVGGSKMKMMHGSASHGEGSNVCTRAKGRTCLHLLGHAWKVGAGLYTFLCLSSKHSVQLIEANDICVLMNE